jgi:hypothetical protein
MLPIDVVQTSFLKTPSPLSERRSKPGCSCVCVQVGMTCSHRLRADANALLISNNIGGTRLFGVPAVIIAGSL